MGSQCSCTNKTSKKKPQQLVTDDKSTQVTTIDPKRFNSTKKYSRGTFTQNFTTDEKEIQCIMQIMQDTECQYSDVEKSQSNNKQSPPMSNIFISRLPQPIVTIHHHRQPRSGGAGDCKEYEAWGHVITTDTTLANIDSCYSQPSVFIDSSPTSYMPTEQSTAHSFPDEKLFHHNHQLLSDPRQENQSIEIHPSTNSVSHHHYPSRPVRVNSRNSVFARTCASLPIQFTFYLSSIRHVEDVLCDNDDRRLKAICQRFHCRADVYPQTPENKSRLKQNGKKNAKLRSRIRSLKRGGPTLVLYAPSYDSLKRCVRALDSTFSWCLFTQLEGPCFV